MEAQITEQQQQRIKVLESNGVERFPYLWEIIYIEGDDNYCRIHLKDGSEPLVRKTLSVYEAELGLPFIHCHKSYLVNRMYIKGLDKKNYKLILITGEQIPIPVKKVKIVGEIIQNNGTNESRNKIVLETHPYDKLKIVKSKLL